MKLNVIICDRCGDRFERDYYEVEVNPSQSDSVKKYQLCKKCFSSMFCSVMDSTREVEEYE